MNTESIVKDTVSQGEAAWIDYLNTLRKEALIKALNQQNENFEAATAQLELLKARVSDLVESGRGGLKGVHGFIAEAMEAYSGNAESLVEGNEIIYKLLDDNGPVDLIRNGTEIQQKFVQNGGHFSLNAMKEHLGKYPDFVKNGGKYQIPKDFYEKVKKIMDMTDEEVQMLSTSGSGITRSQAEWVRAFFKESGISFSDVEPSSFNYADVQREKAQETITEEEKKVKKKNEEQKDKAYQKAKPSLKEGAEAAGVGAALEGGTAFCLGVYKKLKSGKKLHEFDENDWKELGIDTGKGAAKGGIRGAVVYGMTNFTATPSAVASSFVTASFGVVAQAKQLRSGKIDEEEFIVNSQVVCLDAAVSAVSSIIGQLAIPVPILGAMVGNAVGEFLYGISKDNLNRKEQELIHGINVSIESINATYEQKYYLYIKKLKEGFAVFSSLSEFAFSYESNDRFDQERERFLGSGVLALNVGVPEGTTLKSKGDIDKFFL